MKIVYISKYASYAPYGIETRHFYISRELVSRGFEATVYLSTSNHNLANLPSVLDERNHNVGVKWIPTLQYKKAYGLRRIFSWFHFEYRLRKKIAAEELTNDDVVICSSLSLLSILTGIRLKKKWNCKLIFEVRDIWPLVLTRLLKLSKWNPVYMLLRNIELRGYREADFVIGTMPNLREHVTNSLGYEKKIMWIPHLVNTNLSYTQSYSKKSEIEKLKSTGHQIIGYAGSINKSSALSYLLDAAEILGTRSPNLQFIFVGDGPSLGEYKERYTTSNIHFIDKIPQAEVLAFCKDCDVLYDGYLRSELYRYGNSRNKYVEYCLARKPILLAYEGYTHFIEENKCGLVISPESVEAIIIGIETLLEKDATELEEMGENAYTFAQNTLSLEKQVNRLIEEIESI